MSKRINLKSIKFASDGDVVSIGDKTSLTFTDGAGTDKPFSITAWVYIPDVSSHAGGIVTKRHKANSEGEYFFGQEGGEVQVLIYADPAQNGVGAFNVMNRLNVRVHEDSSGLTDETWHHVAFTYNASEEATGVVIYVDGVAKVPTVATKQNYSGMGNEDAEVTIGGTEDPVGNTFEDRIADVVFFNKALSATEIAEVYNNGKVKDMSKASTYNNIISWWKMGDDLDAPGPAGIRDYVGQNHGTLTGDTTIITSPALPTDRTSNSVMTYSSWGRTRTPKNVAGHHQTYIHGGISGNLPTSDPSGLAAGYSTENQRFLHLYWKAEQTDRDHTVTAYGYSHSSGAWALLYDSSGTQVKLSTSNAAIDIYRVFEVSGIDRIYFKSTGQALLTTDLFAAACSTF